LAGFVFSAAPSFWWGFFIEGRQMRFLLFADLQPQKGIPYSDRQLRRLEAKGTFPKRVAIAGVN
jgi:hypothetical protein